MFVIMALLRIHDGFADCGRHDFSRSTGHFLPFHWTLFLQGAVYRWREEAAALFPRTHIAGKEAHGRQSEKAQWPEKLTGY